MSEQTKTVIRWWPLYLILFTMAGGAVAAWFVHSQDRQNFNLALTLIFLCGSILTLLWFVFLSRIVMQVRLVAGLAILAAGLFAGLCFRITGVTGDLIPILEWRWKKDALAPSARIRSADSRNPQVESIRRAQSSKHDYPQFLGPNRNATIQGFHLNPDWEAHPPKQLWRIDVGAGWSGFAVAGDSAVTQEQREDREVVAAYELKTGNTIWTHADSTRYDTTLGGVGPRTTPTIHSNRVYTVGATGIVNCLDLESGRTIWSVNMLTQNNASMLEWGMSGSPLVHGDKLIVHPGGKDRSLVAYDRRSGDFIWGGGDDGAGYSSPRKAVLDGVEQILIFNSAAVASHDPQTGNVLWSHPWRRGHPHVSMPVQLNPRSILVSSGYGTGTQALEVKRDGQGEWGVAALWKSIRLKAKFTNVILFEEHIYGLDDGALVCLDSRTGKRNWKGDRFGHGQVILVESLLLVLSESGEVLLVRPNPDRQEIIGRFEAFTQKTWNPPALAGEYLVIRNDREAACYRLPLMPAHSL